MAIFSALSFNYQLIN